MGGLNLDFSSTFFLISDHLEIYPLTAEFIHLLQTLAEATG